MIYIYADSDPGLIIVSILDLPLSQQVDVMKWMWKAHHDHPAYKAWVKENAHAVAAGLHHEC